MSQTQVVQSADGVVARVPGYGVSLVVGTGAPSSSVAGYAKGCIYQRLDGSAGTMLYLNEGTASSTTWQALGSGVTFATLTVTTLTAGTLVNTAINAAAAAATLTVKASTAAAWSITDATTSMYVLDTRGTVSVVTHTLQGPATQTLPNGATSRSRTVSIPAKTVTLLGQTQVTTLNEGTQLEILAPTYNQSGGAVTVDKVSTLFVGTPVAGASVTITTNHIIMTGTAGCFCTAAGTWTDTSSRKSKKDIRKADMEEVAKVLDQVEVVQFKKIEGSDGDYDRFGVIAEDVPDCMATRTREGVASIYMAGFALAAVKYLKSENDELRARLEKLEAA